VSISDYASLGSIRWQVRQQADLENNQFISDAEMNQYISQSYKRLYNMLVAAYDNNYNVAPLFQFTLTNAQYYPLPNGNLASIGTTSFAPALFKLLRVDLQCSASPTGFVTLRRYNEIETNKYAWPNSAINTNGITNFKYKIQGTNIKFIPVPMSGQLVQLEYIPKPTQLQYINTCATVGSMSLSMGDVTDLSAGMSVDGPSGSTVIAPNTTIVSVQASPINQVLLSNATLSASPVQTVAFWIDSTIIDGISGWEQFIVLDAAIKASIKQEENVQELIGERALIIEEIQGMAEGRDMGQAFHVSDVLGMNTYGMDSGFGGEDNW
jgi:hypothetical protein